MSRNLKTWTECEIHPSAYEIADVFWAMDAEEQAGFFNRLAEIADRLPFQLQSVTDSPHLTPAGRAVMCKVGEYGESSLREAAQAALECLENNGFGRAYVIDILRAALAAAQPAQEQQL